MTTNLSVCKQIQRIKYIVGELFNPISVVSILAIFIWQQNTKYYKWRLLLRVWTDKNQIYWGRRCDRPTINCYCQHLH